MGTFHSTPCELLHQLLAILPINIHLSKLVEQAAIRLLALPTNSPVLHHLGQPWCRVHGSSIPLLAPPHVQAHDSCIKCLAKLVPVESRKLPSFEQPLQHRSHPPADRFLVSQAFFKGEEWKKHAKGTIDSHHSKKDQLIIYCRLMGPNPMQTLPTWTAVCIAYKRDQEIDK
jgi:hypothetical protein